MADLHFDPSDAGTLVDQFARIGREADILALCGDMTTHGRPGDAEAFVEELTAVDIPIVAVLGNHDHETDEAEQVTEILAGRGIVVLNGDHTVIEGIGFAGTKGFAGGFGRGALAPFGEKLIKDFVNAAIDEALKLERALRALRTDVKVALMHYSPIEDTLVGEPEYVYPFLGSSRFREPLDVFGASVVFHGHAHNGSLQGRTAGGVHVYNVALPLLQKHGKDCHVWTVKGGERRRTA